MQFCLSKNNATLVHAAPSSHIPPLPCCQHRAPLADVTVTTPHQTSWPPLELLTLVLNAANDTKAALMIDNCLLMQVVCSVPAHTHYVRLTPLGGHFSLPNS